MASKTLAELFSEIDLIAGNCGLLEPATNEVIEDFVRELNSKLSNQMPDDLKTLFEWHNGQAMGNALLPNCDRRLLSVQELMQVWHFFLDKSNEYLEPFKTSWLPIQTNDCSDYLVYDIKTGGLIEYWHDDPERDVVFTSLREWASEVISVLSKDALTSARDENVLMNASPENMTVQVFSQTGKGNTLLAKEISDITGKAIIEVFKMLKNGGRGSALEWKLSLAENSMEMSRQVRFAKRVAARMELAGITPEIRVVFMNNSWEVSQDDLEMLSLRCIQP
ncbi:SMI1/KNR4 family protein [Bremerella sp.]|uniref:SMI1/KNR4 family protein n=1 Tax=Bremerella sp. TaxID=2795602 RepID=UPI00391C03B0